MALCSHQLGVFAGIAGFLSVSRDYGSINIFLSFLAAQAPACHEVLG